MFKWSVNCYEAFDASAEQHLTIFFNEIVPAPMMGGEIEISGLHQVIPNATYYLIVIGLAQIRHQHANAQRAPIAKRARKQTGLVIEFFRRGLDPVAGWLGDRPAGNLVEDDGDRRGVQTESFGEFL
jgi:hypothetical protein